MSAEAATGVSSSTSSPSRPASPPSTSPPASESEEESSSHKVGRWPCIIEDTSAQTGATFPLLTDVASPQGSAGLRLVGLAALATVAIFALTLAAFWPTPATPEPAAERVLDIGATPTPNSLRIPWAHYTRLGNHLHQLFHALAYAESHNISVVKIPSMTKTMSKLFDMPAEIFVHTKESHADCSFKEPNYLHYRTCTLGYGKLDFRQALLSYVRPHVKQEIRDGCRPTNSNRQLVIHLRGGDLVESKHPQSRMIPCSWYRNLITIHNFSSVKLVSEDGEHDQFCRKYILAAFNGSNVRVEETDHSLNEDVRTLMTSQYVALGLSTFSESLTMMSDCLKKVYVPALKYNGHGHDVRYGSECDMAGNLECDGAYRTCVKGFIEYELYDIPGFKEIRTGQSKKNYIFQEDVKYDQVMTCGHCHH